VIARAQSHRRAQPGPGWWERGRTPRATYRRTVCGHGRRPGQQRIGRGGRLRVG